MRELVAPEANILVVACKYYRPCCTEASCGFRRMTDKDVQLKPCSKYHPIYPDKQEMTFITAIVHTSAPVA